MKCYYHEGREAVAACKECGKYLCKECTDKHQPVLCDDCYTILRGEEIKRLKDEMAPFQLSICLGVVFSVIAYCVGSSNGLEDAISITLAVIFFFVPFGWRSSKFFSFAFSVSLMGLILAALVLMCRVCLSFFIGIPSFFMAVSKLRKLRKAAKTLEIEDLLDDSH